MMEDSIMIKILLDETVEDNVFFQKIKEFEICKPELFKYAIMMWEVPNHLKESDFEYLQSKIPGLELLLSDHIAFTDNNIVNLSKDDRVKKIASEAIGVGLGLKYSVELLDTNPNKFKKIGKPLEGKYLDYSTIVNGNEFEIETKGTVNKYYSTFKKDILEKKKDSSQKQVFQRFGTISMFKDFDDDSETKCVVVDDPPTYLPVTNDDTFNTQILSYAIFLSYILDTKYYNKYIKPLKSNKLKKIKINDKKFFTKYNFKGNEYYGECFDYRLIKENMKRSNIDDSSLNKLFETLTKSIGKTKFFIGLDKRIIDLINTRETDLLRDYSSKTLYLNEKNKTIFLDKDGILIIKSKDGADSQLETLFSEEEVIKRIGLSLNFSRNLSHRCNAPCRSREIKGKPCSIMTFRTNCHFHR
jgi:hypothetical protein